MYKEIIKPGIKKSSINSIIQKKNKKKQNFQFVDNRFQNKNNLHMSLKHKDNQLHKSSHTVQLVKPDDLKSIGKDIDKLSKKKGLDKLSINMWEVKLPNGAILILIGTLHSNNILKKMAIKQQKIYEKDNTKGETPVEKMLNYIEQTEFSKVYDEKKMSLPGYDKVKNPLELIFPPNMKKEREKYLKYDIRIVKGADIEMDGMDEVLTRLGIKKNDKKYHHLETDKTRKKASLENYKDSNEKSNGKFSNWRGKQRISENDLKLSLEAFEIGNDKKLWEIHANYLKEGIDPYAIEARNIQWINKLKKEYIKYDKSKPTLWIIGSSHIPGLLLQLGKIDNCTYKRMFNK